MSSQGVSVWGVSALRWGLSAQEVLPRRVSAWGCLPRRVCLGDVCLGDVCLGVSAQGVFAQGVSARGCTPPPLWTERQTLVKT